MSQRQQTDQFNEAVPTLPEVEFALVLSRIISSMKEDPAQLRNNVYELARIALWKDVLDGDPEEGARLAKALETAIQGVEQFAVRQDGTIPQLPRGSASIAEIAATARSLIAPQRSPKVSPVKPPPVAAAAAKPAPAARVSPPPLVRVERVVADTRRPTVDVPDRGATAAQRAFRGRFIRLGILVAALVLILGAAALKQRGQWPQHWPQLPATAKRALGLSGPSKPGTAPAPVAADPANHVNAAPPAPVAVAAPVPAPSATEPANGAAAIASAPVATAGPAPAPDYPVPTTYGSYAVSKGQLVELKPLEGQVPDKRIAISAPIHNPSRTILSDGSPTFVIFRRDLATLPTDNVEARVIAKITRTMKFDPEAKRAAFAAEDLWTIRSFAYKFRVAPVPGNPEMIIVRPDPPTTVLPAGRYGLVLGRQAYDFAIAGPITDPNQCLERTEAANGTFYSPCKTP